MSAAAARLRVTLRQPAQISAQARSDFVLGTAMHLPGWVVRGAFAARWLAEHGGPPSPGSAGYARFVRLFEGGVRFAPLFTGAAPQPLSLLAHKHPPQPGCRPVGIDRASTPTPGPECTACRSPWEPAKGTLPSEPDIRRRTHVAIGAQQVAVRGQLVSRETLPAGLSFTGALSAEDPALLQELTGLGHVYVGGRRTTHGWADVALEPAAPTTPTRLPDDRLVVTLRSPGVFVDEYGRPTIDPDPAELEAVLGCPATVQRRWARWATVGGWHAASGLPKPVELAVAAGSTYVLAPTGSVGDATLLNLAVRGLGLRRHEGFGDIGGAAEPDQIERGGGR